MGDRRKRKVWFQRNERAEELEAEGKVLEALKLYRANAEEGCDLRFTYERMASIYRNQEKYDEEIEALEKALAIEKARGPTSQLVRLKNRLELSKKVREREQIPPIGPEREGQIAGGEAGRKKKKDTGCFSLFVLGALLLAAGTRFFF